MVLRFSGQVKEFGFDLRYDHIRVFVLWPSVTESIFLRRFRSNLLEAVTVYFTSIYKNAV